MHANWTLEQGDALEILRKMPDNLVDAVITDPPYSSGGAFRGDRLQGVVEKYVQTGTELVRPEFGGDSRDQRSYGFWTAWWLNECYRICKDGAAVGVFTDWRQLPTTTDGLQAAGFVWRGICVWDKVGGRPTQGRPRSQAEYVVWGSKGPMPSDRAAKMLPGVLFEPESDEPPIAPTIACTVRQDDKHHIAGKPTEVMRWINGLCERGGLILDPFAGSGTGGVAAIRDGYRYHGIEREAAYVAIARRRLEEATSQIGLFDLLHPGVAI